MRETRVTLMRITIDYFQIDMPSQDYVDTKALGEVMKDPTRHQLGEQNIVWGTKVVRFI